MPRTRWLDSANPCGTGMPACSSSPRFALLPPNRRRRRRASSVERVRTRAAVIYGLVEQRDDPRRSRRRGSSGPFGSAAVARPVPTTAGSPYSRQTIAACDITPPMSVTAALTFEKIGAHAGEVMRQTRISPSRTSAISSTERTTRARPSTTPGDAAAPISSRAALLLARPLLDALGRHAPEHDRHRVGDRLGRDAERRRRRPLRQPLEQLLAPSDDRRPVRRPERRAAGCPREHQLVERLGDLVAGQLEHVLLVLEEAVVGEQRAELAQLVPPARQEPVVAVELVLLDVREHRPREPEQLVERRPRPRREQRAVLLGEPVALAGDLLARPLDLLARLQRADVADHAAYGMLGSSNQLP